MTRLKKELFKKGIIYDVDEMKAMRTGIESACFLVFATNDFIVTCYDSNVLEPLYNIFDARTLTFIAQQSSQRDDMFFGEKCHNPWSVNVA